MLSHKWTLSLTSLVIILALAFVAPSVMAAEFSTTLSVDDSMDVSFADGVQVEYEDNGLVPIKISFGKVVNHNVDDDGDASADFADNDFQIIAYNKFGGTETPPVIADDEVNPGSPTPATPADGKNFTIDLANPGVNTAIVRVLVRIPKHVVEVADPRTDRNDDGTRKVDGKNAAGEIMIHFVVPDGEHIDPGDTLNEPYVIGISLTDLRTRIGVTEPFKVRIRLSEQPKEFTIDYIDVVEGKATEIIPLEPDINFDTADPDFSDYIRAVGREANAYFPPTGREHLYYSYLVTIEPKFENKNDIVIKVKEFEDLVKPIPYKYTPPATENLYIEGDDKLTVKIGKAVLKDKKVGVRVALPKDKVIPAGGYLVVAESKDGSEIVVPATADDKAPDSTKDAGGQLLYKIIEASGIPNLEMFLANGGVIDVEGPHALIISEIMWGSDASLTDPADSQWIELYNPGGEYKTQDGANTTYLNFYGPADTLPARADVHDRAGTIDAAGAYWRILGIGQSGRTGTGEQAADIVAVVPTQELISIQRVIEEVTILEGTVVGKDVIGLTATAGIRVSDGQMKSSWMESDPPGINFQGDAVGVRIANPGAAMFTFAAPIVEEPEVTVPVAAAGDIVITEIMVDTGDGRLPQWIELSNVSGADVSLTGWSLVVVNAADDVDVVGERVEIDLSDSPVLGVSAHAGNTGKGKTLLLVAGNARSSSNISGSDRVVDISSKVGETGRYTLISETAFMLALLPPQKTGVLTYGDTAGNLGAAEAWDIPMDDSGRSSLIRREMLDDGMATMGTDANGWVLASDTALVSGPTTWYGSDEDAGTPGYDAGGPLPVELSHFRPARDKQTGAVVITWSTQSELNNAGFFIKRSQQREGQFVVINLTMVPGAGTTSEKQFYTYTDTTAQPNVVYYYQIEDVSLDGSRQTLTNSIRLKGHVGAAGKATTTWGDLKTQE
ncbi:hypothetical protein C6500_07090 [Candidatus Poribacteria bacterium]|nr:MAG: hypothetical protein C6500_07090 [Candidatus Poribacteria bacterium]